MNVNNNGSIQDWVVVQPRSQFNNGYVQNSAHIVPQNSFNLAYPNR